MISNLNKCQKKNIHKLSFQCVVRVLLVAILDLKDNLAGLQHCRLQEKPEYLKKTLSCLHTIVFLTQLCVHPDLDLIQQCHNEREE